MYHDIMRLSFYNYILLTVIGGLMDLGLISWYCFQGVLLSFVCGNFLWKCSYNDTGMRIYFHMCISITAVSSHHHIKSMMNNVIKILKRLAESLMCT